MLFASLHTYMRRAAIARPEANVVRILTRIAARSPHESDVSVLFPVRDRICNALLIGKTRIDFIGDNTIRPAILLPSNEHAALLTSFLFNILPSPNGSGSLLHFLNSAEDDATLE